MKNYYFNERSGRQLLVMAAVFLGATLLLVGLIAPQEAQGKAKKDETAQSTSQEPEKSAPPAENSSQKEEQQQEEAEKTAPAEESEEAQEAQEEDKVLDKDPNGHEIVAGELLVTYKEGASEEAKDEAPKQVGAKVEKDFSKEADSKKAKDEASKKGGGKDEKGTSKKKLEVQHLSVPEAKDEQDQQTREQTLEQKKEDLEQAPEVEAVDYNYVREASWVPNDTDYSSKQWALPQINAPQAWDTTKGTSSVRIAILDSGIDKNHPDLSGKVAGEKDFVNNDNDASDDNGHGTAVAGIAAANTNNAQGVAGTCPNCSLLIAKVLDSSNKATDANVISAISWAADQKANAINMSFGLGGNSVALETAINNAWGKGAVLVAAAGNDGSDTKTEYPAAYENVIAVAATDKNNKRAYYEWLSGSYFGPPGKYMAASNAGSWVDIAAPGKDVYTTERSGKYGYGQGTSIAAPHVSGLAGLIFSKGFVSNGQVRNQIESVARDLGTSGKDNVFGHGLVDAHGSVANFNPVTYQQDSSKITYNAASDWVKYSWSTASGGYTNFASRSGATAKLSFTGTSVTWWANKGSYGGRALVYVDGNYDSTVDLYSSSNQPSQPVFTKSWGAVNGKHTVEIRVEGTSGRPWVDVDAFSVTQPPVCSQYPQYCQ